MRILLILPADGTYRYEGYFKKSISYAPLTLTILAALVPAELNAQIDIIDEGVQNPDYDLRENYDVVGITCVTSSSLRAYSLTKYWKNRGAFTVLGGAHPTLMPKEASFHADSIVVGPAELSWPQLLRDYLNGTQKKVYESNISGEFSNPIPRRELQSQNYLSVPTLIANRGCKNQCEFCSVHLLSGHGGFVRPIEEVVDEIRQLKSRRVLLLDPSPTTNKEYFKKFLKAIVPLKIKWAGLSTINIVNDKELLNLAVISGCEGLLIGFESLNQLNINNMKKIFNNVEKYKEAVKTLHNNNISVLGSFVLGFDNDTKESIRLMPKLIDEIGIDLPRFAVLTPFPGTGLFRRYKSEGRILTEDWSLYDTEHVVFRPKLMEPDELQQLLYDTWKETYSLGRILKRAAGFKRNKLISLAASFGFRYYANNIAKRNIRS